jgi:ferredoxin
MSKNEIVWIDPERCTGCGACVDACPVGAIALMDRTAHVDEESCTGCGACLEVCPREAIQPLVEGEIVQAKERTEIRRAPGRAPAVERSRPLVETAAPALAVAGAGLLAKATRALAQAVGQWLTQPTEGTSAPWPGDQPERDNLTQRSAGRAPGRANGRGRRNRHRRRGR